MIKVTIELFPGGDQEKSRVLGVMQISRTSLEGDMADYKVVADENPNEVTGKPFFTFNSTVKKHNRMQSVYGLIAKAARKTAYNLDRRIVRHQYLQGKS